MSTRSRVQSIRLCLLALLTWTCSTEPAFSQGLSTITGFATDPTNAVVPEVQVTVTNNDTHEEHPAITNENGWYSVPRLLPGYYTVRASRQGFKTRILPAYLSVKDVVSVDLHLEIGDTSSVVDVTAERTTVNRINAQIGTSFDQRTITDLPLLTGNAVKLLSLIPGVTISQQIGEFGRDDGGQVNGARNDQQNIELDGVNVNQQEQGGALESVLPVPAESLQGFVVETAGLGGVAGRGSGGQVQLITRSGTNAWHGVLYENYRTTGTSARNYFSTEAAPLILHRPGAAVGGPIRQDKLFFFGAYEYRSDRKADLQTRRVPTPEFLNGNIRYRRTDGSLGTFSEGPGSNLEQFTLVPGDQWNSAVIGSSGLFERYRPFSSDIAHTSPSSVDNGVNVLDYRFLAPSPRNRNIYVSRIDYNLNSKNSVYARGTLNDDVRTLAPQTFPGFDNASERIDNSKGFAVNWNSTLKPTLNNTFTIGLTRESYENTGNQAPVYSPGIFDTLQQTSGASRQAIDTWDISDTFRWQADRHGIQAGISHRSIDNLSLFYSDLTLSFLPVYSGSTSVTANVATALQRALGSAEYSRLASSSTLGDAVLIGTGMTSRLSESVQFDLAENRIPAASPFVRDFLLKEWDFFVEDTFKFRPNLTLNYGLHYSLQTPPYERNGVQMNWTEDLGQRWREMMDTAKRIPDFPLLSTQLSGRANGLPDLYKMDKNNFAPRVSVAWAVDSGEGFFRKIANKGGPVVVRAGYALMYDRIGGRFARDSAVFGSIGLLSTYLTPAGTFSVDGLNNISRAPRIGPAGELPRPAFPQIPQPSRTLPSAGSGAGAAITTAIDPRLHSPTNHLVNVTISKQLPGGWIVEASYVGRFARDLLGQVDLASPPNVRDTVSGMTWYEATDELFTRYLEQSVPVNDIQPMAWYENVYPEIKGFVESRLNTTFASVTQAWYAFLLQSQSPGPNAVVSQMDRLNEIERGLGRNKLLNPQVQFLGLFTNVARSNFNSGQFVAQRQFGRRLTLTMNYTLSKSLDITSAAEARGLRPNGQTGEGLAADPLRPELSYGLSDFDRRHQFSGYFTADLPFGRNQWLGTNVSPSMNQVIGGWQASAIVVAASGRPWNFTDNRFNHHFAGRDQPHVTSAIPFELTKQAGLSGSSIPVVYLIPGSAADRTRIARENFKNSHPGGPIARNQGRGPGYWNVDFALTKNFDLSSFRENMRLRFRWESFNLFNHPNFDIPGFNPSGGATNIDRAGSLGQVTSTLGMERLMQFGLRLDF